MLREGSREDVPAEAESKAEGESSLRRAEL